MRPRAARSLPLAAALVTLAFHLAANPHYGFFRDELYFIICGFRPDWGYVDQPPVVPLLAAGSQLFGHSLFAIRAIPALFAAASVYTTCLLAIELGGGVFAELFAALLAALTPVLMDFGGKITTDVVGLWLWPLAALCVLRIVKGGDPRWWLVAGAAAGIAIESKYNVLFFIAAIVAGLLAVPQRRALWNRWFAGGVAIAVAIALPNFVWQATHGFPILMLLHDAADYKNNELSPLQYVASQVLVTHPLLAPFWIVGLIALFGNRDARFLGVAYVVLILEMIVFHGKHYYPGNVYPIPIAAGAVAVEAWTRRAPAWRPVLTLYAFVAGIALVPLLVPILPERAMSAYDDLALRMSGEVELARMDHAKLGNLPPDWADMHGWPELTAQVARIYAGLPPSERAHAAIFALNYGEAAAIDFYGARYGLPPVLSGHNQYWLWGPRGYSGDVLIDVDGDCLTGARLYRERRVVALFSNHWVRPLENDIPISLCRGIAEPLATVWPQLRRYI
jgi:hypothetical protein